MCVRKPGVHRHETDLGSETDDDQDHGHLHHGGVEFRCRGHECGPVQGRFRIYDADGGCVDQGESRQCDGDSDGAQDDVLPCGLGGLLAGVESHQEGGDKCRGTDTEPYDRHGADREGQHHDRDEHHQEAVVLSLFLAVDLALLVLQSDVCSGVYGCHQTDESHQEHEHGGHGVHVEHALVDVLAVEDGDAQVQCEDEDDETADRLQCRHDPPVAECDACDGRDDHRQEHEQYRECHSLSLLRKDVSTELNDLLIL